MIIHPFKTLRNVSIEILFGKNNLKWNFAGERFYVMYPLRYVSHGFISFI